MAYKNNVFINCPFDNEFFPLLKTILFTVLYLKLNPQIAETSDSGSVRIENIKRLIRDSKYSIHDLSRIEPIRTGDLPRFNMPFELGLDLACKEFLHTDKKCLILEEIKFRYQIILSDISGQDVRNHENEPLEVIHHVRDWVSTNFPRKNIPSYKQIWDSFNEFIFDYKRDMRAENMNPDQIQEIPFSDLILNIRSWIKGKG